MGIRPYFIGTAGWGIARQHAGGFPTEGSHLERYAARLGCVEINSSFYRPHRRATYERWAAAVPDAFRFSVKIPRTITHEQRLAGCGALLDKFLFEAEGLGRKLGVLLVQLPPSLQFDPDAAGAFLDQLRGKVGTGIACEPRHASWFGPGAGSLLEQFRIALVAADPPPHDAAAAVGGWQGLAYFRMHGSPRIYHSDYPAETLARLTRRLCERQRSGAEIWCIFDNTADGHALDNAVAVDTALEAEIRI